MAGLSAVNPHTGLTENLIGAGLSPELQGALVDPVAQKLLHMNTVCGPQPRADLHVLWRSQFLLRNCRQLQPAPVVGTGFAWNHGDIQPEIARTFIGIVGPGVKNLGVTMPQDFFTDHVDLRPTMMSLARPQGRLPA